MKRLCRLSLLVAVGSLGASVAPAQAATELPFVSTDTDRSCQWAARAAGPENCNVAPSASAETGSAIADVRLVSPGGGLVPWTAAALGSGDVVAKYHLSSPVRELRFTVAIHVDRASVTVGNLPSGVHPYLSAIDRSNGHLFMNTAGVSVGALAWSPKCRGYPDYCGTANGEGVLSAYKTGTASASNEDHVFRLRWSNGGRDIPAGDVYVSAGARAYAAQNNGPGADRARIETVVEGIWVEEIGE